MDGELLASNLSEGGATILLIAVMRIIITMARIPSRNERSENLRVERYA